MKYDAADVHKWFEELRERLNPADGFTIAEALLPYDRRAAEMLSKVAEAQLALKAYLITRSEKQGKR